MNAEQTRWSSRYRVALKKFLRLGAQAQLLPAAQLGRQAAALGLETLAVAQLHEQALTALLPAGGATRAALQTSQRAKGFFSEVIVPIERTHRAALKTEVRVRALSQTLRRRTAESSASTRQLQGGIVRRQSAEAALKVSGTKRRELLREAHRLQKLLRDQTRAILQAQEAERLKSSRELHDEIAQTLLAIDVRLLSLKRAAQAKTQTLQKEIAVTQRLVKQSVMVIHRLAHEYGANHAA